MFNIIPVQSPHPRTTLNKTPPGYGGAVNGLVEEPLTAPALLSTPVASCRFNGFSSC